MNARPNSCTRWPRAITAFAARVATVNCPIAPEKARAARSASVICPVASRRSRSNPLILEPPLANAASSSLPTSVPLLFSRLSAALTLSISTLISAAERTPTTPSALAIPAPASLAASSIFFRAAAASSVSLANLLSASVNSSVSRLSLNLASFAFDSAAASSSHLASAFCAIRKFCASISR